MGHVFSTFARMKKPVYHSDFKLGILGGGQLGRMFIQNAVNYNVSIHILDPSQVAPCREIASSFTCGDFNDYQTVLDFGREMDVLTIEIEHVNVKALEELEKSGVRVFPQPHIIKMIQDKGLQKQFYADHDIPTSNFKLVKNKSEFINGDFALPAVQKLRKGGYDGKGVQIVGSDQDYEKAFDAPCVIEDLIDFERELSVIVVRNEAGEISTFPVVEPEFNKEANLVEFLFAPAHIDTATEEKARIVAKQVAEATGIVGILAVELFLTKTGEILVNEAAPRPHNSGHHTIEACYSSQYDQLLRAITGLPAGSIVQSQPAVMVNLLGEPGHTGEVKIKGLEEVLDMPGVFVHLYGKKVTKPYRKMGHVTVVADSLNKAVKTALEVKDILKIEAE